MKWEIFWEIPECPPYLTAEPARFFTRQMKQFAGANFSDCILEYRNNVNIWYLKAEQWDHLDKNLLDKMIQDVSWAGKINAIAQDYCNPCLKFLEGFGDQNFKKMSDEKLYAIFKKFYKIYVPAHASGHPANLLEIKNQRLSKYLTQYLQKRIWTTDYIIEASAAFSLLIAPTKDMSPQKEAKSFYNVGEMIAGNSSVRKIFLTTETEKVENALQKFPKILRAIKKHRRDFCWTGYNWEGPAYDLNYYLASWASAIRQKQNFRKSYIALVNDIRSTKKQQQVLLKALGVDSRHKTLLQIASNIMYLKAVRKDCMYIGAWVSEPMFFEIGRRLGLTTHEARYIFFFEMNDALVNKKFNKAEIRSRTKEVILHQRENKPDKIVQGSAAKKFIKSLRVQQPDENVRELKGQCAYPGKVRGRVKLVNTPEMMNKMEKGDILIAYATQPNLLPAMRKAAAFVTDFGGITCHAAIVAREWKVPCVIGTGNATKILKDGELVEVDATKGTVVRVG